jgi:lipoate-protein ligase B
MDTNADYGNFLNEIINIKPSWRGLLPYGEALKLQNDLANQIRGGMLLPTVIGCEHPSVITLGKRSQPLNDILASLDQLREKKIEIVATDRGGEATFHNPGQLVIYPILPLSHWHLGPRVYVECLERATAFFLAQHGVEVIRGAEPGLWADCQKIAAFGIRINQGVSMHGLAINISNDLTEFSLIKQCGMLSKPTNLKNELLKFMNASPVFNFEILLNEWLELFCAELSRLKPNRKGWSSLELDDSSSLILKPESSNIDA